MHQHKTDSIRIMNKKSSSSSSTSTILSIVIILTTSVVASSALISFPNIQSNNTRGVVGVSGGGFASTVSKEESTIEMTGSGIRSKGQQIISSTAPNLSQMKSAKSNHSNIMRWAVHGVATELFHNIFLRTFHYFHTRLFQMKGRRILQSDKSLTIKMRQPPRHEIAVVTGATGGIGSQIAHELACRGYDVVIAARDIVKGEALSAKIRELMKVMPIIDTAGKQSCSTSADEKKVPTITFVEYHADVPQSAMNVASSVKELGSPMSILINNAGIMGQSKRLTMRVNLLGPAYLTFALLPLMSTEEQRATPPTVINVGSSAHLRATRVFDGYWLSNNDDQQSWIDSLPDTLDSDLSTYARSKLALMQFSTILRHCLPANDHLPIRILDAHPGLVWTSLLRNHIGDGAVRILSSTGLANVIYKSSSEGAQAIVSAFDYAPPTSTILASSKEEQVYFVNGMAGGYASAESSSLHASLLLWKYVLQPELEGVVDMPKEWALMEK